MDNDKSNHLPRGFIVVGYKDAFADYMRMHGLNVKNARNQLQISPFIHNKLRTGKRVDQTTWDSVKTKLNGLSITY